MKTNLVRLIHAITLNFLKYKFLAFSQDGTTALILAAANNHVEVVKELLNHNANVNVRRRVSQIIFFLLSVLTFYNGIFIDR